MRVPVDVSVHQEQNNDGRFTFRPACRRCRSKHGRDERAGTPATGTAHHIRGSAATAGAAVAGPPRRDARSSGGPRDGYRFRVRFAGFSAWRTGATADTRPCGSRPWRRTDPTHDHGRCSTSLSPIACAVELAVREVRPYRHRLKCLGLFVSQAGGVAQASGSSRPVSHVNCCGSVTSGGISTVPGTRDRRDRGGQHAPGCRPTARRRPAAAHERIETRISLGGSADTPLCGDG
jgi:hypothetical protein